MARQHIHHGSWWMVQWSFDWWFSLGLHIDFRVREAYGPYVDFHVGPFSISLGRVPLYTDEEEALLTHSRGGEAYRARSH